MKIVVAIDSLKGSLTSLEAGEAIAEGIHRAMPDAEVTVRPLADGGEGTVEALVLGMNGQLQYVEVLDPLGRPLSATYGILEDSATAVMEISSAAGITLLTPSELDPLHTTSYGVGQMIRDAIQHGCRNFIIGIGGSSTNDGGIGMLQALGYDLLDEDGKPVSFGAIGLRDLAIISDRHVIPELKECTFRIACDVNNPLCGNNGCSVVYGPQKGADIAMIQEMDTWLNAYADLTAKFFPGAEPNYPGSGAAGGLGFAFHTFTNAILESGIQIILRETVLENYVKECDLVVTGEGRLDHQTAMGKAPSGVAEIAQKYKKKVIAFSGCVTDDAKICNDHGIDAFFPILRTVVTLEEACSKSLARKNMVDTVEQVFRLICCYRNNE